jgi:hypothetical protein
MSEMMNQVLGSAQNGFLYGTALYALCYACNVFLSTMAVPVTPLTAGRFRPPELLNRVDKGDRREKNG